MVTNDFQVLLVDDDDYARESVIQTLGLSGFKSASFDRAQDLLEMLGDDAKTWGGVIISDVMMPEMDGLELHRNIASADPDLPVILITAHGDVPTAVEAIRNGVYDFIEKPFARQDLLTVIERALEKRALTIENRDLRERVKATELPGPRILGTSKGIQDLRNAVVNCASVDADVLINGKTGCGKELVARSIHELSSRSNHNFVAINCGALPESIIESELFGHEHGAFTGAKNRRIGKFEHAQEGTLFLDEIESMPLSLQVRLLRVLQERVVERLGSNKSIPINMRVIAATKQSLKDLAAAGEFREDLYYRLNVLSLTIPDLKDRREDIPLLLKHFMMLAANRYERDEPHLDPNVMSYVMAHDWPGNVRELRNFAERCVLFDDVDDPSQLFSTDTGALNTTVETLPQQIQHFERAVIVTSLREHGGNVTATCKTLGISRKTIYEKFNRLGLDPKAISHGD